MMGLCLSVGRSVTKLTSVQTEYNLFSNYPVSTYYIYIYIYDVNNNNNNNK